MEWRRALLMVCALAVIQAICLGAQDAVAPPAGAAREIEMTAKKYEFSPSTITVKKGEHVKLVITALDKDHGFEIEAFKIKQELKKGVPTTVEFKAENAGEFPFKCAKFCGFGHGKMKGKLVVEE